MLRAHRQAWAWQDEYHGLSLEEIRRLEQETQEALKRKMAAARQEELGGHTSHVTSDLEIEPITDSESTLTSESKQTNSSEEAASDSTVTVATLFKDEIKVVVKGSPVPSNRNSNQNSVSSIEDNNAIGDHQNASPSLATARRREILKSITVDRCKLYHLNPFTISPIHPFSRCCLLTP